MLYIVEGPRNSGKTYLLENSNISIPRYKFVFNEFVNDFYIGPNDDIELFYYTIGFDNGLLDLVKKQIIDKPIIMDRGFISDIVYAIQSGRINIEYGKSVMKYLYNKYKDCFKIIYIDSETKPDNRNKDKWDFYDSKETIKIYKSLLSGIEHINFYNDFTDHSLNKFKILFEDFND